MSKYRLDDILKEQEHADGTRSATNTDAMNLCEYWPQIRDFLEWAKKQTSDPKVIFIINALIILGNRLCAGLKPQTV
jgi:hypothetical protein